MGVFDDFYGTAKDMTDAIGKKTGELVEISKLKLKASQLSNEIQTNYEKLGRSMYTMTKSGYENNELIDSIIQDIDVKISRLKRVEKKISELKNIIKCNCCGTSNGNDSMYCNKCGSRLTPNRTAAEDIAMDAVVSEDEGEFHESE